MYYIDRTNDEGLTCKKCGMLFDISAVNKGVRSNFVCMSCKRVKSTKMSKGYHGLNEREYADLLSKQKGCCAICREKFTKTPNVDHCHKTGHVRGLLCFSCNIALGKFKDDIYVMKNAIEYLQIDNTDAPIHASFTRKSLRQAP